MDLPDFMSYSNKFTTSGFIEKISRIAKRAGAKLVYAALILYYTLQSDKISVKDKAIIVGAAEQGVGQRVRRNKGKGQSQARQMV